MSYPSDTGTILALDIGSARIGLALANRIARIAHPDGAIANDAQLIDHLREYCRREDVSQLVVGLPRSLDGAATAQTAAVQELGASIAAALALPVQWQDEAVTSVRAEAELRARGKPYSKGDIDALAATYILEDYLHDHV